MVNLIKLEHETLRDDGAVTTKLLFQELYPSATRSVVLLSYIIDY